MFSDLTDKQLALADFMSSLSEKCYCAGWMQDLEFVLWDAVLNGERKYGQDLISQNDIEKLKKLSKNANCWIYFDDLNEESPIDILSWEKLFDQTISENPKILKC